MNVSELFSRCVDMAMEAPSVAGLRYMHQTLVLTCGEALRNAEQGYGNLFSQVDFLCKCHAVGLHDRIAIQTMRRRSNGRDVPSREDWLYDVRALALLISATFRADIPHELVTRIPTEGKPAETPGAANLRYVRCVVTDWAEGSDGPLHIGAEGGDGPLHIETDDDSLTPLLRQGMQLNLLDCRQHDGRIQPGLMVVEPDFLVDISAVAACFQEYGHHPVAYLLNRLKPRPNSQQILLGNLASAALDDLINQPDCQQADTLRRSFRQQALQFCTCQGFDAQRFKADAWQQAANISQVVDVLAREGYDRHKALLEPSFVCERLGLQGRVDLMTTDMRLLVEQKSGKNWNLERKAQNLPPLTPYLYKEDHYVQLLLYYGVLRYNFHLSADRVDIRLLYSKYPARQGLLVVNFYQQLFREAIRLRNRIVAQEVGMAREGFASVLPLLKADTLLENPQKRNFFDRYIRPEADRVLQPLHRLSAAERDYAERMLTFVYREQLAQKVGVQEGQGGAVADLWNMPLTEKQDAGTILTGRLTQREAETVTLATDAATSLPNFRRGDMVYLYRYEGEPDVRAHILYKGVVARLTDGEVTVRLNDRQQNRDLLAEGTYAVEHASSDIGTTSAVRSIRAFCAASQDRRDLLLGRRAPRRDESLSLSRPYHPHYDDMLLHARQACDYFLLQGPPGTGKTSMALRFLVQEELARPEGCLLLMAYTNRAVDEICGMLTEAGIDYLRLGNEASCDERYTGHLLEQTLGSHPRLDDIRRRLEAMRVVVGTTSTLQAQPFLLVLKNFSLAIVDEASQLLEPNVIGLLASERIGRFILIGDHKQLPAVVQQPDSDARLHDCRLSLFERLLRQERLSGRTAFTAILRRQGRMHPDIAQFPNAMFYHREQLECVPCEHQLDMSLHYDQPARDALDALLQQHRVLFLPSQPCSSMAVSDKVNASEAGIVADLLQRIHRQYGDRFDPDRTVGVIVPYRNQIAMIRREAERLGIPALMQVSIDTVERYQGSQRDVIIYSFTIQRPYQLDFLTQNCFEEDGYTIDRKLNVAMTRARKQLLMTGNAAVLRQNRIFAELIRRYSQNNY